nr:hypothetical protein L203_02334 [Cryptococcus depauperatus CBS 7841]
MPIMRIQQTVFVSGNQEGTTEGFCETLQTAMSSLAVSCPFCRAHFSACATFDKQKQSYGCTSDIRIRIKRTASQSHPLTSLLSSSDPLSWMLRVSAGPGEEHDWQDFSQQGLHMRLNNDCKKRAWEALGSDTPAGTRNAGEGKDFCVARARQA